MNILIDTSPLANGHAGRGIGMYTRLLIDHLNQQKSVQVFANQTEQPADVVADVIHYPFFDLFFDTLPVFKKTPTVVTIHDVIPLKFPKHYQPGKKGMLRFFKQKVALRNVAAVITDSVASKQDIVEHLSYPAEKIHVIYLAANPLLQVPSQTMMEKTRKKYALPKQYILYVGDINYNKNIPQLLKALKFLPDEVKLVCIGKNFQPQSIKEWQWIETQMALSDVTERVKFITDIAADELDSMASVYHMAAAYVQPSLYEGFGLPILEAMQCRVPVICSQNSSLIEVAGNEAVFVQPDAVSLAEGIKEVLSWSDNKRQQRIRSAYKWSQQFSWEKVAKQTVAVYQQVMVTK